MLLAAHRFLGAYRALPWLALGWALYGLYLVFVVITGRARVTSRNLPAAAAGLTVNVVLLLLLVPRSGANLGIAGAGIALCGAYVAMLLVMYLLTRGLFEVGFEWRRLMQLTAILGGVALSGELLLPTHGPGVVLRGGLAQSLAALGMERRRHVAPVAPGRASRLQERRQRAHRVRGCGEPAHRSRGGGRVVLAHVEIPVAGEFDDPPLRHRVAGQLLVVDGGRRRDVHAVPARVSQPASEVDLVRVHEEVGVEVVDLRGGRTSHQQRCRLAPVDLACACSPALHGQQPVQEERAGECRHGRGKAPRAGPRRAVGAQQARSGARGARALLERLPERVRGATEELGVLVEQQRI